MKGKTHPNKGGTSTLKGKTLKMIDGKKRWVEKEASV
jgi:hypothetical protein